MRVDPAEFVGRMLFWCADYDPKVWAALASEIRGGDRVLDIGAHCGTYGLRIAPLVGPSGRLVMVEPNPIFPPRIRWAITTNGFENAMVDQVAIGSEDGRGRLIVSDNESVTASLQESWRQSRVASSAIEVDMATLPTIMTRAGLDRIDIMKVDAEGVDEEIIRQALLLDPAPRCIVFEFHHQGGTDVWDSRLVSELEGRGYEIRAIAKSLGRLRYHLPRTPVPGDCFDFVAKRMAVSRLHGS